MITKKVIDNIYCKYKNRPESPDELNLGLLFGDVFDHHGIMIDENELEINSIDPASPFHTIPLSHINAIIEFDEDIAIVLHSSIIFLKKTGPGVNIHVKMPALSFSDKLKSAFSR